jgi:hypothetical protein
MEECPPDSGGCSRLRHVPLDKSGTAEISVGVDRAAK